MTERDNLIEAFLNTTEWSTAKRGNLAGDASNRRYERLTMQNGNTAVLMDAPPDKGEDITPFVAIAEFLSTKGLSAPAIIAQDQTHGFLLLEDLGDAIFARVMETQPNLEHTLYEAAIDVLVDLHRSAPPADLPPYDQTTMSQMAAHAWRWYRRGAGLQYEQQAIAFEHAFAEVLSQYAAETSVLIQRDYHAENLIWLPERNGVARVGLLDFQDAMAGHPAYDLVSLLQDARRDVPENIEREIIQRYVTQTGTPHDAFDAAYHVLGAQRNLRIIGVFARLSLHIGKPHYVDFLPRVWGYLERDLAHPALSTVADRILSDLPKPTADLMQRLKDQCATIPTL